MTGVLIKELPMERQAHRGDLHINMKAERGVVCLQAGSQEQDILLTVLRELPTPRFGASSLQDCMTIHVCCLNHTVYGALSPQSWEIVDTGSGVGMKPELVQPE